MIVKELKGPLRVMVAPMEVQPPKKVSDIIDMESYDAKPFWHDLGAVKGVIALTQVPARARMHIHLTRTELLMLGKRSSRLVALRQDPDTKEVSGASWPVATMHPVNPDDLARARRQPDDLYLPLSFDVSVNYESLPREASAETGS